MTAVSSIKAEVSWKERPMLFSTDMVKSILAKLKTMTRRTKGLEEMNGDPDRWTFIAILPNSYRQKAQPVFRFKYEPFQTLEDFQCPYGKVGDLIWVRETFTPVDIKDPALLCVLEKRFCYKGTPESYIIEFDGEKFSIPKIYKPSIHMPKAAARIWLEITDIRVERLKEISKEDAIAEGIKRVDDCYYFYPCNDLRDDSYIPDTEPPRMLPGTVSAPQVSFTSLWASINGWDSWNANPWVWVISFKVLSTTGRPAELGKEVAHA